MKTGDAQENGDDNLRCFTCQQEIKDGHWFARIKVGDRPALFCGPRCVELFLEKDQQPATGNV